MSTINNNENGQTFGGTFEVFEDQVPYDDFGFSDLNLNVPAEPAQIDPGYDIEEEELPFAMPESVAEQQTPNDFNRIQTPIFDDNEGWNYNYFQDYLMGYPVVIEETETSESGWRLTSVQPAISVDEFNNPTGYPPKAW